MPGGILWGSDWDRIRDSALRMVGAFPDRHLRFAEIGVADGRTSRDLIGEIQGRTRDFTYHGIDPAPPPSLPAPYVHVRLISRAACGQMPRESIHWVFVDGCHCAQCVAWDALNYGQLLAPGGTMAFHDAAPGTQGLDPQTYAELDGIHDREEAARGIQVRKFLDGPEFPGWLRLVSPSPSQGRGGVEIYEKS